MSYPLRALPSTTYAEDVDLPVLVLLGLLVLVVASAAVFGLWRLAFRRKRRGR
jgi:hypothetical protein